MKSKKIFSLFIALVTAFIFFVVGIVQAFAHPATLNVEYDGCVGWAGVDGIDEAWYVLDKYAYSLHLSHNEDTIKYYFADYDEGGSYTWTSDVSQSTAEEIKSAYADSMKKWNNVYFYSYNSYGVAIKNKIINVVEGTETDHNLTIYPATGLGSTTARVIATGDQEDIENGEIIHLHYSEWKMEINIDQFYVHDIYNQNTVNSNREKTGAHELGHILGLKDIDEADLCNPSNKAPGWHHGELLMGYALPGNERCANITYKDIAGAAILRGFHTDYDHRWLNCGLQNDGTYKLLCSICNGVIYVDDLSEYTYDAYNFCGGAHDLSSGNMMAVASYGDEDYYKCKYCRYVAPFDSIVPQNYNKNYYSESHHQCINIVEGLEYMFYEEHNVVDGECTECGYHIHSYTDHYTWQSVGLHKAYCDCDSYKTESHVVAQGGFVGPDGYGICMLCRGRVFMGNLLSVPEGLAHTDNGSYILPNGTIILVEEDVEAYLAGTLEFYYGEKE